MQSTIRISKIRRANQRDLSHCRKSDGGSAFHGPGKQAVRGVGGLARAVAKQKLVDGGRIRAGGWFGREEDSSCAGRGTVLHVTAILLERLFLVYFIVASLTVQQVTPRVCTGEA